MAEIAPLTAEEARGNEVLYPGSGGKRVHNVQSLAQTSKIFATFNDLIAAQNMATEVKEALIGLKAAINRTSAPRSESFEL